MNRLKVQIWKALFALRGQKMEIDHASDMDMGKELLRSYEALRDGAYPSEDSDFAGIVLIAGMIAEEMNKSKV